MITSYKSLKWHLLTLWYLNPQLSYKEFTELSEFITHKPNGFITFEIPFLIFESARAKKQH